MHKQLPGVVIFLFIFVIMVNGCTQSTGEKLKFIGTWTTQVKTNPMDGSSYTDTVIFSANGSYTTTTMGIGRIPGKWDLQNGKLLIDIYYPGLYRYTFSENNTVLRLTSDASGTVETLTKH